MIANIEQHTVDLAILDGEADRRLADWSRADATATLPVDPLSLPGTVVELSTT